MSWQQYDIVPILERGKALALILQYFGLDTGDNIIIAPLVPAKQVPEFDVFTPLVTVSGTDYRVAFHLLSTVNRSALGNTVMSAAEHEYAFQRAHQRLFFGN